MLRMLTCNNHDINLSYLSLTSPVQFKSQPRWRRQRSGVSYTVDDIVTVQMWASDKVMPLIIGRAVGAAVIESLVFCSLAFMVRMDDSVEEWFSGTLCLTKQTASSPCQWTRTELASRCNVNKWVAGSQAWILHVLLRRSDWSQRRLGGAYGAMERSRRRPVSPVMLFTGA